MMSVTINKIIKMIKTTLAAAAAATAIPVKPNIPAMIETTKKVSAQLSNANAVPVI